MRRINELGQVVSGVGGPVSVDGRVIAPRGTCAQWWNKYFVVYQRFLRPGPPEVWDIVLQDVRDGVIAPLSVLGCNYLAAWQGDWAAWNGIIGLFGSVEPSTLAGLSPTKTDGRGAIAKNGTIGLKASYQSTGPVELVPPWRKLGDPKNVQINPSPYGLCILDENRAVWDGGNSVGLGPIEFFPGALDPRWAVSGSGVDWWCYWVEGLGLIAHRTGQLPNGYLLSKNSAFHHDLGITESGRLMACWSTEIGEAPESYRVVDVWNLPIINLVDAAREPITPQNRPMWFGCYTGQPGATGGWDTNDDPPNTGNPPGNGYLDVPSFTFFDLQHRPVASYCPGGSVEEIEEKAKHAPHTPIAYWDARRWPRWPVLPKNSWLCLQGYRGVNESLSGFELSLRLLLVEIQEELPGQLVALVPQCYTQREDLTKDIQSLVPVFSRLGATFNNVIAFIPFNGNGRKYGMQDNPSIRPLWAELLSTIPGVPAIVPVEDDVKAAKVSIQDPIPPFSKDGFKMTVKDPNNGQDVIVTTKNGSWYVEWKTPAGGDKSGSYRPVIIKE